MSDPDDRLLARAEVAALFQVSPSTITRWAQEGRLPSVRTLGGHRRYRARVVRELVPRVVPLDVPIALSVAGQSHLAPRTESPEEESP